MIAFILNRDSTKANLSAGAVTLDFLRQHAGLTGVKEGEEVVTSGQLKLKNGSPVIVNNQVRPTNDPAPRPVDE